MPSLKLTGIQYDRLGKSLRAAFPTLPSLTMMVRFKLDRTLADISMAGNMRELVFELIQAAEAEGWTAELLASARETNPGNQQLLEFAREIGLSAAKPGLEQTIKQHAPFFDPVNFRTRLGEIENQVCRIEIPTQAGTVFGTGFLLGPSAVMTNYHVVEPVIRGEVPPSAMLLRFDYKRLAKEVVNEGTPLRAADADWLIDSSPVSPSDLVSEGTGGLPAPDELDYAMIRLQGTPGLDPVGASVTPGSARRGWVTIRQQPYAFTPNTPLMVMQHPDAAPLKLALDMSGIVALNGNQTRVTYTVNTEGGSSGSPCFSTDWELVALHHSGDPNFDRRDKPTCNQGIPFAAILALLTKRGKLQEIGEPATT
jgi:hypothetical protein